MADPTPTDPFTAGYQAILAALKANALFNQLVMIRPRNLNDFSDGKLGLVKQVAQVADLTEVTLLQTTFALSPYGSSSKVAEATQVYPLVSVTDTLQVTKANAVKWAVLGALYRMNLEDQLFNGKPYIHRWSISGASDGSSGIMLPGTDAARGVFRLSSILNISVDYYIAKTDLPA